MTDVRLARKIGLGGAVFLLVGNIVGASIFILPGQLAAVAGPAVFIAYLIACVPAIFNCLTAAQIGCILPVSAADYVFTSSVLHPMIGFLKIWAALLTTLVGGPILAYGFADYMAFFLPDVDRLTIAVSIVVAVAAINLAGLRTSVRAQILMVCFFVASLLTLGIGGLFYIRGELLTPVMPNGWRSVLDAAVPAFFSYTGFTMLLSFTEEIKNPAKNVPLTILFTFIIVATLYTLTTLVVPGLIPWQELGSIAAPLSAASETFLPAWFSIAITISALLAAGTSINVLVLSNSRSFFALARNRIYPAIIGRISKRTGEPDLAVIIVMLVILAGVAVQGTIVEYASITVIGWMLYGIVYGIALVKLPSKLPDHYNNASFKLKPRTLWLIAVVNIIIGSIFIFVATRDNFWPAMGYFGLLSTGAVYYLMRSHHLDRQGISLQALLRHETEEGSKATR